MVQPSSESTRRIGARAMRHALASLREALLGPSPGRASQPAEIEIEIAWTQTQLMWTAPAACPRGAQIGGHGSTPRPGGR
jgi:hypothetical protein